MRLCLAIALIWAAANVAADPAKLVLNSRISLDNGLKGFGGLSGVMMRPDGKRVWLLNDQGQLFNLALVRDDSGDLTDFVLQSSKILNLYDASNRPDTEGLAPAPDGGIYVSIEDPLKVLRYSEAKHWPIEEIDFPELKRFNGNRGLEGLAIDAQRRLVTVPETVPWDRDGFPVYRREKGQWSVVTEIPSRLGFYMVGADFGPDGALYLLERAVSLLGFRSQIRRVWLDDPERTPEVLYTSHVNQFDNLEGLDVWQDGSGVTRVTVVSDDNFLRFQDSEMLEFSLKE